MIFNWFSAFKEASVQVGVLPNHHLWAQKGNAHMT